MRKAMEDMITVGMTQAQIQGAFIMSWRLLTLVFILGSFGAFAPFGLWGGFASADTKSIVTTTRVEYLEGRMFDLKVKQCTALEEGKPTTVYTVQLQELNRKYKDLTGVYYKELPACVELK
jgi:hypothetical protein